MLKRLIVPAIFVFVSNSAVAQWQQNLKTDPFTDQKYTSFKSEQVDGKYLSLTCGFKKYAKYLAPRVVIHDTKEGWSRNLLRNLKFRVDSNQTLSFYQLGEVNKEVEHLRLVMQEGSTNSNKQGDIEKLAQQLSSGKNVLVKIGNQQPISFELKGYSEAVSKMDSLCKEQVGKDQRLTKQHEDSDTYNPLWIKTD
ncbi:hypothetical protein IC617_08790 [Neiella sp. HB171785]|uniref:Uncharacterized protein n=1 Tax=Neiella litorisoli TaxID=2771431 RepID=A0A8J6UIZ3_9GAMM|nr:hypothetical protein [Neiella litorisoli]MBD1389523.1 hypothetical protein [Neiella litorisoli]